MTNYLQALGLPLASDTPQQAVREKILGQTPWAPTPTTRVPYNAGNRLLVIADEITAERIESQLDSSLTCYIALLSDKTGVALKSHAWHCESLSVSGYLGQFDVRIGPDTESIDNRLSTILGLGDVLFDQVIDCAEHPHVNAAIKPPGYYHVGSDPEEIETILDEAAEMVGEFEKPRYFNYDPGICAHSRSGITGCERCINACPTQAIISIGDTIEVNPHLCQGGGTCSSSCPTGAIRFVYPRSEEQIELLRLISRDMRKENDAAGLTLLVIDEEHGKSAVSPIAATLPGHVVPLVVEEIGAVGLDTLGCALAYGFNRIVLLGGDHVPGQALDTLQQNMAIIESVIGNKTDSPYSVSLISSVDELTTHLDETEVLENVATFATSGDKRSLIRQALTQLYGFTRKPDSNAVENVVPLPANSLFGTIEVAAESCTLCMGCVSQCPSKALQAGGESPALRFIEANCVQCGICQSSCPESAITLTPRLCFDVNTVNSTRTMKEEMPFHCLSCGKAFATTAMINRMTEKLKDHWMFQEPEAMNRLRMCEDCRVKDMFDKNDHIQV